MPSLKTSLVQVAIWTQEWRKGRWIGVLWAKPNIFFRTGQESCQSCAVHCETWAVTSLQCVTDPRARHWSPLGPRHLSRCDNELPYALLMKVTTGHQQIHVLISPGQNHVSIWSLSDGIWVLIPRNTWGTWPPSSGNFTLCFENMPCWSVADISWHPGAG